jgi:hypothetical protein
MRFSPNKTTMALLLGSVALSAQDFRLELQLGSARIPEQERSVNESKNVAPDQFNSPVRKTGGQSTPITFSAGWKVGGGEVEFAFHRISKDSNLTLETSSNRYPDHIETTATQVDLSWIAPALATGRTQVDFIMGIRQVNARYLDNLSSINLPSNIPFYTNEGRANKTQLFGVRIGLKGKLSLNPMFSLEAMVDTAPLRGTRSVEAGSTTFYKINGSVDTRYNDQERRFSATDTLNQAYVRLNGKFSDHWSAHLGWEQRNFGFGIFSQSGPVIGASFRF